MKTHLCRCYMVRPFHKNLKNTERENKQPTDSLAVYQDLFEYIRKVHLYLTGKDGRRGESVELMKGRRGHCGRRQSMRM